MSRLRRYNRFWAFLAALLIGTIGFSFKLGWARALLLGFDMGAVLYIGATVALMTRGESAETMRDRAAANDADHHILLIIGGVIVSIVMTALWVELTGSGGRKGVAVAIAGMTMLLAWLFSNLLVTLHYAHLYYTENDDGTGDAGGLEFPQEPMPDYGDFAYYAFVLGMTFQVSDVQITARPMRRMALFHGLAAFLFNIVVVAISVSLISGQMA